MQDHNCRKIIRLLEMEPPDIPAAIRIVQDELELNSIKRASQPGFLAEPEPEPLPLFQFEMEESK
jgi:hypothetical protein